jgi:hypothetical protein
LFALLGWLKYPVKVNNLFGFALGYPSSPAKTKPKPNKNATATQAKKETTAVACVTTVPDTKLLG